MYWVVVGGAYVILWWLAFFVALPIGMHNEDDPPGQFVPGQPPKPQSDAHNPRLGLKLIGATVAATLLWAVFYGLVRMGVVQL